MRTYDALRSAVRVAALGGLLSMSLELVGFDAFAGTPGTGRAGATRSVVYAKHGMVACAQPLAAQAGLEVLKAGGSAVDAAIAASTALPPAFSTSSPACAASGCAHATMPCFA